MKKLFGRGRFTWIPVILILGGFIWFAIRISNPPEEAERENLVTGTIHAADPLKPDGPFVPYVALHKGEVVEPAAAPEFPLDDRQPDGSGAFDLSADPSDGTRFYLLVRFDTARQERFCKTVPLPEMRHTAEGAWLVAETGKPLEPQRITVDKSVQCPLG